MEQNNLDSNFIDSLNWRYATKKFNPLKLLSDEKIEALLQALRLAPSSFGLQPWRFLVISDSATKEQLYPVSWGNQQVKHCSHLVVLCAPVNFGFSDVDAFLEHYRSLLNEQVDLSSYEKSIKTFLTSMNSDRLHEWVNEQAHIALGILLSAAATMRIDSCPMGGFLSEEYDRILGLKEQGLRSVTLCALGYRADDDTYASNPKVRFSADTLFKFIK